MPLTKGQKVGAGVLTALGLGYLAWKFWPRPPVEDEEEPPVPGTATLRGYVTDRTGKEIAGIAASINGLEDTTTFRGRYKFTDIEATTYELVFTDPLGRYATLNYGIVTLKPDETEYVNVSLDLLVGTGALSGYVTDSETGGVVTGQSIQLLRDGVKIVFDRTDARGKYEMADVPSGSYTLFTESNIYKAHSETVTIVAGISQRKDLILEPKGTELGELMLDFPHDSLKGTLWNYGAITITNVIFEASAVGPQEVKFDWGIWREDRGDFYYTDWVGVKNLGTLISGEPVKISLRMKTATGEPMIAGTYAVTLTARADNAPEVTVVLTIVKRILGMFEYTNFKLEPKYSSAPTTITGSIDIFNTGSYIRYATVEFLVNGTRIQPYDENIRYYNNGELVRGFNMRTVPSITSHIDIQYDMTEPGTYEITLRCSPRVVLVDPEWCSIDADCPEGYECTGRRCTQIHIFTDTVYIG